MKKYSTLLVLLFLCLCNLFAQEGFNRDTLISNYTEYRKGNYPLIVTVPHGGREIDSTLTLRTKVNCPDPKFTISYDSQTPELADLVDSIVFARTGKYPHIVIMKLKRTYIDVNRDIVNAIPIGCDKIVGIYNNFYENIALAKSSIDKQYGAGLLLDFHSHGHNKQEIEIGY